MTFQTTLTILLPASIILIFFIAVGIFSCTKIKDANDFYFGVKKLGLFSFASNIFGANFSFITAIFVLLFWSYMFGFNVFWTIGTAVVGMIAFSLPKITPLSKEFLDNGTTLHEYISGINKSKSIRIASAMVTVLTLLGFVSAQVYIFSGFISSFVNVEPVTISIIIFLFLIGYTVLGGFDSVVRTDVFQSILILFGCIALYSIVNSLCSNTSIKVTEINFTVLPAFYIPMLIVINGLWQFSAMDMWQRSVASREIKLIRSGSALGGLFFIIASVFIILLGLYLRANHLETGVKLIEDPFALVSSIIIPGKISTVFLFALFISAFLSTADTMLIAASQAIMTDIYEPKFNGFISLVKVRISTIILGILSFLLNLLIFKFFSGGLVIAFLLTFFSCQIVLLPAICVRAYLSHIKINNLPILLSIISGLISSFSLGIYAINKPDIQNLIPVVSLFISAFFLFSTIPFSLNNE